MSEKSATYKFSNVIEVSFPTKPLGTYSPPPAYFVDSAAYKQSLKTDSTERPLHKC